MSNIFARIYDDLVAVTPSDATADPKGAFASLLVTAPGSLKITTRAGTDISLAAVVVGQVIEVAVQRVWSTGTSATVLGYKGAPVR